MISSAQVLRIRQQRGWSQQLLATRSGVNKAYISEYETGLRPFLPAQMQESLEQALLAPPTGSVTAEIRQDSGWPRLVLTDTAGNETWPDIAVVRWRETDGTTNTIYLGLPPEELTAVAKQEHEHEWRMSGVVIDTNPPTRTRYCANCPAVQCATGAQPFKDCHIKHFGIPTPNAINVNEVRDD